MARLNDKSSEVRKATCISLGQLGVVAANSVPLICLLLKDQHMDVVTAAQKALDELQPYRAKTKTNTCKKSFEEVMNETCGGRGRSPHCSSRDRSKSQSRGREDSKSKEKKDKSRDKS